MDILILKAKLAHPIKLVLSTRKNKLVSGEDLGDGIRRQGRTGRGFTSTRSLMPMSVEKPSNVGTAKQLRSARVGFDKAESKAGRPPTRKLSDRRAYTRQRHTVVNATADFLVGSDGLEEVLAAVNAVINPTHACPNPFWRQMEPFFGFISDVDITYLKQQILFPLGKLSSMIYGGLASIIFCGYITYDSDNLIKRYSYDIYSLKDNLSCTSSSWNAY